VNFEEFRHQLLGCRYCQGFGIEPKPIVWGEKSAKIVQVSQAPSKSASECGLPFSRNKYQSDASGRKLIEWYRIPRELFYNPKLFYITGMAHCYPGRDRGGDTRPPLVCAEKWLEQELSFLDPHLYIIIGQHSANFFFPDRNFTELVFQNVVLKNRTAFVLPHPSPANKKWFKDNPKFESDRLNDIRKAVHEAIQPKKNV
jgi:uracil-DNA glycosylase family 4